MLDGWAADRLCERLTANENTAPGTHKAVYILDEPQSHIVEQTELTDECINRIADAVVRKLRAMEGAEDELV